MKKAIYHFTCLFFVISFVLEGCSIANIVTATSLSPTLTATSVPPTLTLTATPAFTATSLPPTPTFTLVPTQDQSGNTYYVSANGNDVNPGTFEQPYKTIQKGIDDLVAGDTLYVRGGTYTEKIDITSSGTSLAPIVISSYPEETAIMDGSGLDSQLPKYTPLVMFYGSYIIFENFELTYPNGRGVFITKYDTGEDSSHNILRNLNIHHMWMQGISVWGSYNLIENNKIWQTVLMNASHELEGGWAGTLSFGDSSHPYYGLNTIISNNEVYQNYGEGILGMYTDNALIEGNRVWDNWALGIYSEQCSYITIKNNLIYYTNDETFWRYPTHPADGILIGNEDIIKNPSHPIGHNRIIFNNIIVNAGTGIGFWAGFAYGSALVNDTITYNTIVLDNNDSCGFRIGLPKDTNHQNTVIENNLVLVNNGNSGYSESNTGLTFANNLWSITPDPSLVGTGDIVADPLLINPNQTIELDQIAYPLDATGYMLTNVSPAIDKAIALFYVTDDFDGIARPQGVGCDIGAYEFYRP